jgi:hypothetical protein
MYDRAETTARSITGSILEPEMQAKALGRLAGTLAAAGLHDRAEAVTHLITERETQAKALAGVAEALARAGEPIRARQLIARAWAVGHWSTSLSAVGSVTPSALLAVAANRFARAGTPAQTQKDYEPDPTGD